MFRLAALALAATLHGQPLHVGIARVDITPDKPVALGGYSNPETRISEGIHDRLYARAVAFRSAAKRFVLVSCDISGFQVASVLHFQKDVVAKFGLAEDELVYCGIHTHSAPMVFLNRTYPHPNNWEYAETLRSRLVDVVGQALAAARPARLGAGAGSSDAGVNRRLPIDGRIEMLPNPAGPMDPEVQVLAIATPGARRIGALFAYAVHSRTLTAKNRLVSGDLLGIAEQYIESTLGPPVIAPVFAGASGDIDPRHVVGTFDADRSRGPSTVEQAHRLGEEVVRVFRSIDPSTAAGPIRTKFERAATPAKHKNQVKTVAITAARVGEIAFLAMDCEALVDIGKAIKARSPFRHTFLLTNCNGGSGYLPPALAYPEGGYEVNLTGFAPDAAARVVDRAVEMLRELRN